MWKYDSEGVVREQYAENEAVIKRVMQDLFDDDVYPRVEVLLGDDGAVIDILQSAECAKTQLKQVITFAQTKLYPAYSRNGAR